MHSAHGDIGLHRPDGRLAMFTIPGEADRPVALKRRDVDELLAEELRRLDNDDVYEDAVQLLARSLRGGPTGAGRPTESSAAPAAEAARKTETRKKPATKKSANKQAATRKSVTKKPAAKKSATKKRSTAKRSTVKKPTAKAPG
jgi:hypothetical protein